MSEAFRRQHPVISSHPMYQHADLVYNLPFRLAPAAERVLVVGAGTGNDVAAALRNGARMVDAVEIDPTILALGANMFGALIGGILEYSSMAWGIRSLTLLALGLYGLSWLALAFRGWRLAWEIA
jgi:hypothetical protein